MMMAFWEFAAINQSEIRIFEALRRSSVAPVGATRLGFTASVGRKVQYVAGSSGSVRLMLGRYYLCLSMPSDEHQSVRPVPLERVENTS